MDLTSLTISIDDVRSSQTVERTVLEDCGPNSRKFTSVFSSFAAGWTALLRQHPAWLAGLLLTILAVISGLGVLGLRRPSVARSDPASSMRTAAPAHTTESTDPPLAPPMTFPGETLVGAGVRQRAAKCSVLFADRKLYVEANDSHRLLHELRYNDVLSISYSHSFDPIEATAEGPRRVARAPRGPLTAFGIFVARDWITLRTTNAPADFVVLRFDNEAEARRALKTLEKRTGRSAERAVSRAR